MSNMLVLPEGHYLDDAETVISTTFVDVRDIGNRTPIAGLIKSSREVYAIRRCGTVHVCTLKHYREHEDPRIRDPGEGYASRAQLREQEVTDDPVDVRNHTNPTSKTLFLACFPCRVFTSSMASRRSVAILC